MGFFQAQISPLYACSIYCPEDSLVHLLRTVLLMFLFLMSAPGATSPCPSSNEAGPMPREGWHTWGWEYLVPPGCPAAGSGTIHIWETFLWRVPLLLVLGRPGSTVPWELLLSLVGSSLLCFEHSYTAFILFVFSTLFKWIILQLWAEQGKLFSP